MHHYGRHERWHQAQYDEITRLQSEVDRLRKRNAELEEATRETQADPDWSTVARALLRVLMPDRTKSCLCSECLGYELRTRITRLDTPATEGRPHRPLSPDHQAAIRESIERDLGSYAPEDDY